MKTTGYKTKNRKKITAKELIRTNFGIWKTKGRLLKALMEEKKRERGF